MLFKTLDVAFTLITLVFPPLFAFTTNLSANLKITGRRLML